MASLTNDELIQLCDFDGNKYIQKSGDDYISALSNTFALVNKNDKPFTITDIEKQPSLDSFCFSGKNEFKKVCSLELFPLEYDPNTNKRKNEVIKAVDFISPEAQQVFESSLGVVYLMTCNINGVERIIKIGQTRNTFKDRLSSYNCGCVTNWRTASTTNLKLKQSMVVTRKRIELYLFDCQKTETFTWHGVTSVPFASPFSLAVEDIMIKQFILQFKQKPLINIQANATTV